MITQQTHKDSFYRLNSIKRVNNLLKTSKEAMIDYIDGKITIHQLWKRSFIEKYAMRWEYFSLMNTKNGKPECTTLVKVDGNYDFQTFNNKIGYFGDSCLDHRKSYFVMGDNTIIKVERCWTSYKNDFKASDFLDFNLIALVLASKNKRVIKKMECLLKILIRYRLPFLNIEDILSQCDISYQDEIKDLSFILEFKF